MMKKTPLILSLVLVLANINAAYVSEMTRHFDLQAGYESASAIHITPIPAQSQSYIAGMPFSIEDPIVTGESDIGREIATWTLLSNVDFNIVVSPGKDDGKMYPIDRATGEPYKNEDGKYTYKGLDYTLTFRYQLGYVHEGGEYNAPISRFIYHSSEGHTVFNRITEGYKEDNEENTFIGTANGSIFFKFDDTSSTRIKTDPDSLPAGDYMAYVTITLEDKA